LPIRPPLFSAIHLIFDFFNHKSGGCKPYSWSRHYALFGFQAPSPYAFVLDGIDIETWNTGAAARAKGERISQSFDTPLVTNPGRFLTVILRMPVGTATAGEVFQGMVNLRGE
jgi:hypothetical protein